MKEKKLKYYSITYLSGKTMSYNTKIRTAAERKSRIISYISIISNFSFEMSSLTPQSDNPICFSSSIFLTIVRL
ncbi:hypothetical protein CAAN1_02S06634 [[Candida] anglica]|uniref:Uncharacterized protein n=1 Tax=[Candida] anglica TaxID=148631 RepID=A0ABP0ECN0_9ASCO